MTEKEHEKSLIPDLEDRMIIDVEEELELLKEVITQCKIAVPWMVKTLTHATDEIHNGMYSDELKHAIAVDDLLKKV